LEEDIDFFGLDRLLLKNQNWASQSFGSEGVIFVYNNLQH
jgi:hypothetical protein